MLAEATCLGQARGGVIVSVLWETGLGSCLIIIIGIGAAVTAIMPPKSKKPGAVTPGQTNS